MAKTPDKKTSPKVATKASKALQDPKSTKAEKSVAASDLAQAKMADKQTSPRSPPRRASPSRTRSPRRLRNRSPLRTSRKQGARRRRSERDGTQVDRRAARGRPSR